MPEKDIPSMEEYLPDLEDFDPENRINPSSYGLAVLHNAQADIGVSEDLGKNDGQRIREYFKHFGMGAKQDWCAAAVSSWMLEAGSSPIKGAVGAREVGNQFAQANLWIPKNKIEPKHLIPGNIAVWSRGPQGSGLGHIGVIESSNGNNFTSIEGNSGPKSNAVVRNSHSIKDANLLGIGMLTLESKIASASREFWKKLSSYKITKEAKLSSQISLTEREKEIFELLMAVVREKTPSTVLRAAGGWVRDKLLGKASHDIDIAIDNMTGVAFAKLVLEWMKEQGMPAAEEVTTVEANTEANKNIESAQIPILGISVDFVQLRKDVYNDDSRNPEVEFGVPAEEDAKRRDLTINSLFYNINEDKVEDFVGGIDDLENKVARTPIDPVQTYLEDPLRILRAVRFAAKYDLQLDPGLIAAANDPRVQESFSKKITKERILSELIGQKEKDNWKRGLLIGPNFDRAARLLKDLGIRDLILKPNLEQIQRAYERHQEEVRKNRASGEKWNINQPTPDWDMEQNNPHHTETVWNHTMKALEYLKHMDESGLSFAKKMDVKDEIVRNLAMLLHDSGKCDVCSQQKDNPEHYTYRGHEVSSALMAEEILTDLKAPNDIKDRVVSLIKNHMRLHGLPSDVSDKSIRSFVTDLGPQDSFLSVDMSKGDSMGKAKSELDPKYDRFGKMIDEYLKMTGGKKDIAPPITGKEIMSILGLKPGPEVGKVTKALKEALLENPAMTKEEAINFIQQFRN